MPQVIPQPLDQMSAGLSEEVSEQPASASANQSSVRVDTPYLTLREAAAYCRLAPRTLYNRRREIPRVLGTRKLLFTRAILDKWLGTRPKHGPKRR